MLDHDALHQRGMALEDEFFHRVDDQLVKDLRQSMEREAKRQQLATTTGFQDHVLLDHLLDAGFDPATITALVLVPLVFVAWADDEITPLERQSILSAAIHRGLKNHPLAFTKLDNWLYDRPPQALWNLWKEYVAAISTTLAPTIAEMLRNEMLRLAKSVAEVSRGKQAVAKVSKAEQDVLDELSHLSR